MIDLQNLTDKELVELSKKINEEREARDRYYLSKLNLMDREKLAKVFENLFDINLRADDINFDNPSVAMVYKEYEKTRKDIFGMVDLVCGNYEIRMRRRQEHNATGYEKTAYRKLNVERPISERYQNLMNNIINLLEKESENTKRSKV